MRASTLAQASSIQNFGVTCESITVGHNPAKMVLTENNLFLPRQRPLFFSEHIVSQASPAQLLPQSPPHRNSNSGLSPGPSRGSHRGPSCPGAFVAPTNTWWSLPRDLTPLCLAVIGAPSPRAKREKEAEEAFSVEEAFSPSLFRAFPNLIII